MNEKIEKITWEDSHFNIEGWIEFSEDFSIGECIVESYGKVIYEDENTIVITGNYIEENEHQIRQINGFVAIPKICIKERTTLKNG